MRKHFSNVMQSRRIRIQSFNKLLQQTQFNMDGWPQNSLSELKPRGLHFAHLELTFPFQAILTDVVLVSGCAIPKTKEAAILCITTLQTQEKSENLKISTTITLVTSIVYFL
jgi:hypothetical protein